MRKYKFDEYKNEIKKNYFKNFTELEPKKTVSRRPRKKEDLAILMKMAKWKFDDWIKTGKLTIIGERKYKLGV
ncbi:hypothetical protein HZA55_03335 [Candidatus Poribacteria bacterium]|nr:hypothetical protein [Candidatus Poribacteria bacterium]